MADTTEPAPMIDLSQYSSKAAAAIQAMIDRAPARMIADMEALRAEHGSPSSEELADSA